MNIDLKKVTMFPAKKSKNKYIFKKVYAKDVFF